jgi:hypothetical protein
MTRVNFEVIIDSYLFNLSAIPVSPWPTSKWHPSIWVFSLFLSFFLRGCKERDLVFIEIAVGEIHVGLAWDSPVIPFSKQIARKKIS